MITENKSKGFSIFLKEIPAAFIAESSYFSPKFPIVINEAIRTAIGRANGTNLAAE